MPDYLFFLLVGGLIMKYGLANFATTLLQIFQVLISYVIILTKIAMILMLVLGGGGAGSYLPI